MIRLHGCPIPRVPPQSPPPIAQRLEAPFLGPSPTLRPGLTVSIHCHHSVIIVSFNIIEASHFGLLSTPSPELGHSSVHHPHHSSHEIFLHNQQLPAWEVLRSEGNTSVPTGSKRSHDYNVDDFFTDMKKRRVNPSYDPRKYTCIANPGNPTFSHSSPDMAERLNNMAYSPHTGNGNGNHGANNFNPRSVSLDIRTPEELAAVNEFLVTLGRDVSSGGGRQQQQQQQQSGGHPLNGSQGFSPDTYFDAVSLGQLGLAGMPGIPAPTSSSNFSSDAPYSNAQSQQQFANNAYNLSRTNHTSVQAGSYNMYGNMNDSSVYQSNGNDYCQPQSNRRSSGKYASANSSFVGQHYHHPTPPLEISSPHSTVSTPINTTPPQIPLSMPDTVATFDYLHSSRGAPPVPHLARPDYMPKSMRTIVPLKTAPGTQATRAEPVEPRLTTEIHRGPPAKLTPSSVSPSKSGSLYPLLTAGDVQYKLPPMQRPYRSPSPPSRESTPSSSHSSPLVRNTVLPSLRSIAGSPALGSRSPESEELSKEIGRIELETRTKEVISQEERQRHANLIMEMIVTINNDFKKRFGPIVPREETRRPLYESEASRDVEMTAA